MKYFLTDIFFRGFNFVVKWEKKIAEKGGGHGYESV